ncbi:cysteine peptidase family C39 domain-containing protein, partial [Rhodoferax sp. UBA5149]|uniref:cysteine peptidase family C39 domain-containing protein n=1 Tax=Rhodoferax sp. UBA5149 TaxID=1947379 RepID=UPI0025CF75C2
MTVNSSVLVASCAGAHSDQANSTHPDGLTKDSASKADALAPLAALCTVARFHQIAADPATLAHQLGLSASDTLSASDVLRAAQHLGLKAKLSRSTVDRLALTPLPALALMRTEDETLRLVILAQSDGQRVLFQDVSAAPPGSA